MPVYEIPLVWFIVILTFAVIGALVVLILLLIWGLFLLSHIVDFVEDKQIERERKKNRKNDE